MEIVVRNPCNSAEPQSTRTTTYLDQPAFVFKSDVGLGQTWSFLSFEKIIIYNVNERNVFLMRFKSQEM